MLRPGRVRLLAILVAGLLMGGLSAPAAAALPVTATQPLITWAASADVTFTRVTGQTVRNVVTTSVAGRGLPVTVPAGVEVLSDRLPGVLAARQTLAVSIYLDADVVLDQPGVETVILLEGSNDINTGTTAAELIAGYRELIARAHADDTCILGGTLTPNEGGNAAAEARRQAVNDFVRASGEFDGMVDFDAAVRDRAAPATFRPVYDSGDGLHPSDAGYQAMGDAVPLGRLDCGR